MTPEKVSGCGWHISMIFDVETPDWPRNMSASSGSGENPSLMDTVVRHPLLVHALVTEVLLRPHLLVKMDEKGVEGGAKTGIGRSKANQASKQQTEAQAAAAAAAAAQARKSPARAPRATKRRPARKQDHLRHHDLDPRTDPGTRDQDLKSRIGQIAVHLAAHHRVYPEAEVHHGRAACLMVLWSQNMTLKSQLKTKCIFKKTKSPIWWRGSRWPVLHWNHCGFTTPGLQSQN
mmetsp:Transcript_22955/g.39322  ORF Transcript_22955/g.39322 Transcript_22955/m.39322 type:complete len:233 (-) Transcript_22955:348-1046(-)